MMSRVTGTYGAHPRGPRAADVVVFGSANVDLVLPVARVPGPGETVLALGSRRLPGGKGANQAVAAARAGARTALVGAVGSDPEAALVRSVLAAAGVDVSLLRTSDQPTGLAVVAVAADADNAIVVVPGANATVEDLTAADRDALAAARVLLAQLETPLAGFCRAAAVVRRHGGLVVLNAAPSLPLPAGTWSCVDVLVVNEHEAADLLGPAAPAAPAADPVRTLDGLLRLAPAAVLTLGAAGACYAARDGTRLAVPAPPVDAVDTTAAGDTFCGVLAAALAGGRPVAAALRRATAAAALCVQQPGAIPSIPSAERIDAYQREVFPH
jgi:ribokinase